MQSTPPKIKVFRFGPRHLHFTPEDEAEFKANYYAEILPSLRLTALALAALFAVYTSRDFLDTSSLSGAARVNGAPFIYCLLIFGFTFWKKFERYWQPIIMVGAWIAAMLALSGLAAFFDKSGAYGPAGSDTPDSLFTPEYLFFEIQTCILVVCFSTLRLQFNWALPTQVGVLGAGMWIFATRMMSDTTDEPFNTLFRFCQPILLVLFTVSLATLIQERLARGSFEANRYLARLQQEEHDKRVESERMLHVLSSAIGSIVHDLGNPLTLVQSGSATLHYMAGKDGADPETLTDLTRIISDGAQMLDFLRLSLIEQTRLLEGKPIPIEPALVSVRSIVEAGVRFQKPHYAAAHALMIEGEYAPVWVDEKRFVTVMMNLIGNAFKYSDGKVCVTWQKYGDELLVAIADDGIHGQGITQEQASRLFVPFGRLESHTNIEGIGLGLLSAQKVVESHGGTLWIEGYQSGTPTSELFSTAPHPYPAMLKTAQQHGNFRTAFVLSCPMAPTKAQDGFHLESSHHNGVVSQSSTKPSASIEG